MYQLLKNMRVIEGAAFIAGPSCCLHLAQMGAEVIRFDSVKGAPDGARWPVAPNGASYYWEGLNKGKRSIAINLEMPEGRQLAQRLAASGDGLFVTNYPVDGFLSYERLSALRSNLICLRVMGWANGAPAVDYTVNAAVGVPYMTGHSDDERPVNHVLPAWDLMAGAYSAFALLAAERERRASGRGRELRLALSDLAAATLGNLGQVAEVSASGADRPRSGNDIFGAFGRDFLTADGERLMIVAITPRQWSGLVQALAIGTAVTALEKTTGVSFAIEGARYIHREALFQVVEAAVRARRSEDLAASFDAAGVCWSRYQALTRALSVDGRLFADNPIFSPVSHATTGTYATPGAALRIPSEDRLRADSAPRLGQHTDQVLSELLGLNGAEIGRLHDEGIVA
jgi:2-methylfumaryl-CoA isomerase